MDFEDFADDAGFCCDWCYDDADPAPRVRRPDKNLCVRCNRAVEQARTYRLDIAQRNAILRVQRDLCALCQEGPDDQAGLTDDTNSFWHIDHDHSCCATGGSCGRCVRGLLCRPCNVIRLPAYERLPAILRDSPRFNTYLDNPPARQPEARPGPRDHTSPRDTTSHLIDAFFDGWNHSNAPKNSGT
ncbi:endonuclease domain-containing protein [Streptomyces sp. NPDC002889]|uniref:endonuclease domain-containing protein n=1 Tax=Streptomyces sp. NPDC002889 TaxID=3364669 RepID=UPI00367B0443